MVKKKIVKVEDQSTDDLHLSNVGTHLPLAYKYGPGKKKITKNVNDSHRRNIR